MSTRMLPDGRRQVIDFLLPGDFCHASFFVLRYANHSVETITPCAISNITTEEVIELISNYPKIGAALWWGAAHEDAILRGYITALGRQTAYERVAHFFCELWRRLDLVGLVDGNSFEWPVSQELLADALGLSPVHISRTLGRLQKDGHIRLLPRRIVINNLEDIREAGQVINRQIHTYNAPARLEAQLEKARG